MAADVYHRVASILFWPALLVWCLIVGRVTARWWWPR